MPFRGGRETLRKDGFLETETVQLLSRTHLQPPVAASEAHHTYGQLRTQMPHNFTQLISSPNYQVGIYNFIIYNNGLSDIECQAQLPC